MTATRFTLANVSHPTRECRGLFALRDSDDSLVLLNPKDNLHLAKPGEQFEDAEWDEIRKAMIYIRDERAAVSVTMDSGLIIETHE